MMADEQTQALDDTAWWAFEGPSDGLAPALSFDEPLEWPEVAFDHEGPDDDGGGGGPPTEAMSYPPAAPEPADSDGDLQFPPVADPSAILERERTPRSEAGDQAAATEHHLEALPESIWAADAEPADDGSVDAWRAAAAGSGGIGTLGAGDRPSSTFYAETEPGRSGRRFPFELRPGQNIAAVALISFVSVVLLLMFLSVRARNDVPVEPTRQAPADEISASRPLNTVPLTTTTPTTPPVTIALSELVPASDDGPSSEPGAAAPGGTGAGAGSGATAAPSAGTATTAPRAAAPSGGGGSGAASPQTTTATTAPPSSGSETTTPPASNNTSNNSGSSTNNTTWRPQTTSPPTAPAFTVPIVDFPGATTTAPPYTWPTFPKQ